MKRITILLLTILFSASGCETLQENYKHHQADKAKADAERIGNSGPLYDHYEGCLNKYWTEAFDSGMGATQAYDVGVEQCTYELSLLCDYYGVSTCYQDAGVSNKVLFLLMRLNY